MRVMHIVAGRVFGGVETHLVTLARFRHLCPEMETHFGVCYAGRLSEELRATGAPTHVLGAARLSRPWTIWNVRRELRRVVAREGIEAVVCHMAWAQAIFGPAARSAHCASVIFLQNPVGDVDWLERWARRARPDLALCVSQDTARSSSKLYPDVPAQVVYSPMPEFASYAREEVRPAVRRELNTPEDSTVFVQASRMDVWKGHANLLEALGLLADRQGWVLWMAGGPQNDSERRYFAGLQEQAARLGIGGRVQFLGQRRDVPRLMAAADVFCQANTGSEGFSWAFMEACAASLPIVTSAVGGAPEIVDPSSGILVPPGEVEALAAALGTFVGRADLCRAMGEAGRRRLHQMCDRETQLRKLHSALLPLARETRTLENPLQASR